LPVFRAGVFGAETSSVGADEALLATTGDTAEALGAGVIAALAEGTASETGVWEDAVVGGLCACVWRKPKTAPAIATPASPTSAGSFAALDFFAAKGASTFGTSVSVFAGGLSNATLSVLETGTSEPENGFAVCSSRATCASPGEGSARVVPAASRAIRSYVLRPLRTALAPSPTLRPWAASRLGP